jgi:hypothetical protein
VAQPRRRDRGRAGNGCVELRAAPIVAGKPASQGRSFGLGFCGTRAVGFDVVERIAT